MPISLLPNSQGRADRSALRAVSCKLALPLGLLALAGCAHVDRTPTSSIVMDDYRNRHPIILAETVQKIDIFPSPQIRGLDGRSAAQVAEFGRLYRAGGQGPITIFLPTGGRERMPRDTIAAIHRVLAESGARAPLRIAHYPVANPDLASPVRLAFMGLQAKVADKCGEWPRDLASGSSIDGWENRPYWNFGCSYQSALAAQVADPRDLVSPRAEDPADTQMRDRAIASLRQGKDPTTDWKTKNTSISSVGSQ